jgi:hypothetical protein
MGVMLVIMVGGALLLGAWAMRLHAREMALRGVASPAPRSEMPPPATRAPAQPQPSAPAEAKSQWDDSTVQHVQRLIQLEHDRNVVAISTAKLRLDEDFRRYSERVPQFIEALNSLPEKARLARALFEDRTESGNETQAEAAKLFAENVVPLEKLRSDISEVVAAFGREVEANRSLVLASAVPALNLQAAPASPTAANMDLLLADFSGQLARFLGSEAGQVPTTTLNSVAHSVLVEEALRKKVTAAMESHDSEPKRAAAVGTAVGVLAAAADYWLMQSRFESALTRRCQGALDKIQAALWTDPQNGLEAGFTSYVDLVRETHLMALKRATSK